MNHDTIGMHVCSHVLHDLQTLTHCGHSYYLFTSRSGIVLYCIVCTIHHKKKISKSNSMLVWQFSVYILLNK